MANSKVSIRQLRNQKWQIGYVDPFTKRRVRKRFLTLKEAREYEKQVLRLFENSKKEHLQLLTIKELMEMHIDMCPKTRVDERRIPYESFIEKFGNIEIRNLSPTELKKWLDDLKVEREYAEITAAHIKGNLNHFFNFLIDEGIIQKSPLAFYRINRNAPPKNPRVFLTQEEIKEILNAAKKFSPNFLYPFFMALIHTGARRSEMVNLEWKDVDFKENLIRITDAKGGSKRPVKMSKPLRALLDKHPRTCKHVFTNPDGGKIGRSQLQRHITSFKYTCPFTKNWNPHAFRHSFAYNFLKKGGQMYELMAVLGHKTILLTVDLYGKLRSEDVENPSPYDF